MPQVDALSVELSVLPMVVSAYGNAIVPMGQIVVFVIRTILAAHELIFVGDSLLCHLEVLSNREG